MMASTTSSVKPGNDAQEWVGPDLPSLGAILIGSVLFLTGGTLIFTVIGIPFGITLFAAGLGLMRTPKERTAR